MYIVSHCLLVNIIGVNDIAEELNMYLPTLFNKTPTMLETTHLHESKIDC